LIDYFQCTCDLTGRAV